MQIQLSSTAFAHGETIPKRHTGDGPDLTPALIWSDPPGEIKSFALICDDPDAPRGTWVHWVLFNIPATCRSLPEGMPHKNKFEDGSIQGITDFQEVGYNGPAPPSGKPHRYFFKLYALSTMLTLPPGSTKGQVEQAMKGHVMGEGELMGIYGR